MALTRNPVLLPEDFPLKLRKEAGEGAPSESSLALKDLEKQQIQRALKMAGGNKKLAAELFGIHRRTLYRLAKRYGIDLGAGEE